MINDAELIFSTAQEVTSSGTASTNVLDFGPKGFGDAEGVKLWVGVDTTATSADTTGTASVKFDLEEAGDSAFTSGTTVIASVTKLISELAAGAAAVADIHENKKRYLRVNYKPSTTLTAGKFDARLVYPGAQTNRHGE